MRSNAWERYYGLNCLFKYTSFNFWSIPHVTYSTFWYYPTRYNDKMQPFLFDLYNTAWWSCVRNRYGTTFTTISQRRHIHVWKESIKWYYQYDRFFTQETSWYYQAWGTYFNPLLHSVLSKPLDNILLSGTDKAAMKRPDAVTTEIRTCVSVTVSVSWVMSAKNQSSSWQYLRNLLSIATNKGFITF